MLKEDEVIFLLVSNQGQTAKCPTPFVEVNDKLRSDTSYRFGISVRCRKGTGVERWNVRVPVLDVCNKFHN